MGYKLDLGAWNGIFAVPCDLVDRQLRLAGTAQIKALLYILRHSGRSVELSELAQSCAVSEGDAADAVAYWQQEGIIVCHDGKLSPPEAASSTSSAPDISPVLPATETSYAAVAASAPISAPSAAATVQPEPEQQPAPKPKAKERIRYSYNECAQMMSEDCELRQMLSALEGILSKNLNNTEISVFITLVKWYGLPPSCVAMLVEYCREIGKASLSYIESTGIGWVSEDIVTVEQVDSKISRLRAARSDWAHIRTLLDIPERAPTKKEQEYSTVWLSDWHMSDELISLAYERCVDSKGKLSVSYMNGILANWQKKGFTTVQQVQSESAPAPSRPSGSTAGNSSQNGMYSATYDKDDIESMLDEDWLDDM